MHPEQPDHFDVKQHIFGLCLSLCESGKFVIKIPRIGLRGSDIETNQSASECRWKIGVLICPHCAAKKPRQ